MLRDNWLKWFERRIQLGRMTSRRRRSHKRLPVQAAWIAQELESRTLLTTYTVDNMLDEDDGNTDPGDLSLREAIGLANANPGADEINFLSGAGGFGGAVLQLTLGDLTVTDDLSIVGFNNRITLNGGGLILDAGGPGETLIFSMTGVGVNNNTNGPGLLLEATDDELIVANISNAIFNNSAEEGIKMIANTGGEVRLTLTDSTVGSNGDTVLSAGIGVDVGVSAPAESNTIPGKFSAAKLNMSDVDVLFNPLEGLDVNVATGGRFQTTTPMTNVLFQGNGGASTRDQLSIRADGAGTSVEARFDTVTANNAKKSAFNFEGTAGANLVIVLNNSSGTGAGSDAIGLLATGTGTTATVSVNNFVGDGAGLFGLDLDVMSGASVRFNNFNNVSLQNTGRGGVDVDMIGGDIPQFSASNVNVSGGLINGLDLFFRQGTAAFTFNGLTSNNNVERGVQINSIVSAVAYVTINNLSAVGNQTKQPFNIVVNNLATLNLDVNGGTVSSAGTDPNNSIFAQVKQNAIGNLSFDGLTVNNSSSSAFVTRYDFASSGHYEITNTTATGSQVSGLGLYVYGNSNVTGNFDGFNVSGSGVGGTADAIRIEANGHTTTASFAFNNVNASNASRDGVSIKYFNRATGAITKFDNINAQNAGFEGLALEVRGMANLTSFVGNGVNVSGAGKNIATAHDGALLQVLTTGTMASINLQNLTANNATGRGINLLVHGGATANVVVDTFSANNNGFQGLNAAIGTISPGGRLLNSTFRNGSFNNNGTAGVIDGIRTRVTGTGAVADVTFDNVSANGNTQHGHSAFVDAGGDLTLQIDNGSTANNNFLNGLRFVATNVTTKAELTSLIGGNTFDGNNDNGLFVELTDGVTVRDLTIRGGASNNNENGGVILANDLSGVTINNIFISSGGSSFSDNDETGLVVNVDSVLGLGDFVLDGVTASGNLAGATGVNTSIANLTLDNLAATNVTAQGNNGDGLRLLLDNVTVTGDFEATGFNTSGNAGDGVDIELINATSIAGTMSLDGNSGGNTGDGVKVIATDASGISIGTFAVTGSDLSVNGNMGNGLTIDFNAVVGITSFDLSGMVITNNAGDQVFARFKDMPAPLAISFDDATATGPGAGMGTGDGIDLTLDNTTASSLSLNRINASSNGGDGLKLNLLNAAVIPATSIDVGTFNNNGQNGIGINITDSTASIDVTNSTFQLLGTIASASGNGNDGMRVRLNNATLTMNQVDRIIFDNNGRIGVNIEGATPSTFTSAASFTNNTITNNDSFGFRGVFNGGDFDIAIGSRTTPGQGNLFNNNTGAAISLDMIQNSVGLMTIIDNTIINTNDDNDPATPFQGAGIFVRMLGTANPAQATNTLIDPMGGPGLLIRDNRIGVDDADMAAGNDGTGINFLVEEQSVIDGLHVHDNIVDNSGVDGLNFRRLDEVVVNDFQILRNSFNDSGDDGIEIIGQNDDNSEMDVEIGDNDIMRNGNDGVALQVNAEAGLDINMHDNMIVQNVDDGLQLTEVILDIADQRRVVGSVADNIISENGNRGINSSAVTSRGGSELTLSDNTIGLFTDEFDQPIFLGNGSTGVEINGAGSATYLRNDIRANGRLVTADRTVGHGIDIQGAGFKRIDLTENLIRENFQDGIEFENAGGTFSFDLNMIDNRVQDNAGRGLDILNKTVGDVGARSEITIFRGTTGNTFNSNGEEGIYAVNTASPTQTQDVFAATPLLQDGDLLSSPQLSLVIDHATISNNGDPDNVGMMVASAGVVMRVGSSDAAPFLSGTQPVTNQFATSNFTTVGDIVAPVSPTWANGGMFAQLTSSTLAGNFGEDVFIHGYRSTEDPAALGGAWTDMEFSPTGDGDPLARLDLRWGGNSFQSIDVNNEDLRGTPDGQAGAFYDNAEGTFKSRLSDAMPPGPFAAGSEDRRRNAQRVPARTYAMDPGPMTTFTLAPDKATSLGDNFVYAGMGQSTFRLATGSSTGGFILDDDPFVMPSSANGIGFTGTQGSFELPFGWGAY